MATKTKTKSKKTVRTAQQVALELEVERRTILDHKEIERKLTGELLTTLHAEGKNEAGNYHIVKADTFKVAEEQAALEFAIPRGLTKIDTAKVKKVFQLDSTLRFTDPTKYGFEVITQEKISPKRGSYDNGDD